ncbi:Ecl1p SCDLUD_001532 [Saccharomycodes ludwigii]|uniref:Ecl1p n=1 Tax=Saccharomycodes ludwigii TaxID=36035 RepID=UPI001E867D92|nr:hypothetical protein SCDLUD_001532 [Saccharomycodes ludwigii]KAH3901756.1 hypothetical protein SCDLUD_001532 [Saccharomycodes ludwigii]
MASITAFNDFCIVCDQLIPSINSDGVVIRGKKLKQEQSHLVQNNGNKYVNNLYCSENCRLRDINNMKQANNDNQYHNASICSTISNTHSNINLDYEKPSFEIPSLIFPSLSLVKNIDNNANIFNSEDEKVLDEYYRKHAHVSDGKNENNDKIRYCYCCCSSSSPSPSSSSSSVSSSCSSSSDSSDNGHHNSFSPPMNMNSPVYLSLLPENSSNVNNTAKNHNGSLEFYFPRNYSQSLYDDDMHPHYNHYEDVVLHKLNTACNDKPDDIKYNSNKPTNFLASDHIAEDNYRLWLDSTLK